MTFANLLARNLLFLKFIQLLRSHVDIEITSRTYVTLVYTLASLLGLYFLVCRNIFFYL